jgi:hypothetical protein
MSASVAISRRAAASLQLRPPVIEVPPQGCVFSNVTVVNPGLGRKDNQRLEVRGSAISHVADEDPGQSSAAAAPAAPYAGAYLLPGLIDMHVHYTLLPREIPTFDFSELTGVLFLMHGVTTVREMGNFDPIWDLRERLSRDVSPAPRMFLPGKILDGDPPRMGKYAWPLRTPEEAREAVHSLAARKVDFIKVYDFLSPELLAAIREAAAEHGLKVIGHLPLAIPFEEAHLDELEHLWAVQLTSPRPRLNFNNPQDFADFMADWATMDQRREDDIVRISVEQKVAHTPTIIVQERVARMMDPSSTVDPVMDFMPRCFRDGLWSPEFGIKYIVGHSPEVLTNLRKGIERIKVLTNRLYREGLPVFAGSDTPGAPGVVPGVSLHEELNLLNEAGMSPEEVWTAATRQSGESLGLSKLGVLEAGAPADMLVFREDPSVDLKALSTLEAVVANGRLYTKAALDDAFARHRRYFQSWLYDRVTVRAIRGAVKSAG